MMPAEAERVAAFALVAAGETVAAAAAAVGCTKSRLTKLMAKGGTTAYGLRGRHRPPPRRMTATQLSAAMDAVAAGESLHAAGERYGIGGPALSHAIKRAGLTTTTIRAASGLPARSRPAMRPGLLGTAIGMIGAGHSMREVARRLGLPQSTLWGAISTAGLTVRIIRDAAGAAARRAARGRLGLALSVEGAAVRVAAAEAQMVVRRVLVAEAATVGLVAAPAGFTRIAPPRVASARRCLNCGTEVKRLHLCDYRLCSRCRQSAAAMIG